MTTSPHPDHRTATGPATTSARAPRRRSVRAVSLGAIGLSAVLALGVAYLLLVPIGPTTLWRYLGLGG